MRTPKVWTAMEVARVETASGSHIEPPLDDSWDEVTKLRWKAGVVAQDTGLDIRVLTGTHGVERIWPLQAILGRWRTLHGQYSVAVGKSCSSTGGFHDTWTYLNGVSAGHHA